MQNTIVAVIVIAAVIYLARRLYRNARALKQGGCGCGCDGCTQTTIREKMPDASKDHR